MNLYKNSTEKYKKESLATVQEQYRLFIFVESFQH